VRLMGEGVRDWRTKLRRDGPTAKTFEHTPAGWGGLSHPSEILQLP
jgi:hypothetical protein